MKKEILYHEINQAMDGILAEPIPFESALVSLIALLKEKLSYVSWVGFYRAHGSDLWVGPYQGKLACLHIPSGKGVCGAAFAQKKTIVVPDVHAFPGHIACDAHSRSEIVLPVRHSRQLVGVLDLDSYQASAFDEKDSQSINQLLLKLENLR